MYQIQFLVRGTWKAINKNSYGTIEDAINAVLILGNGVFSADCRIVNDGNTVLTAYTYGQRIGLHK